MSDKPQHKNAAEELLGHIETIERIRRAKAHVEPGSPASRALALLDVQLHAQADAVATPLVDAETARRR